MFHTALFKRSCMLPSAFQFIIRRDQAARRIFLCTCILMISSMASSISQDRAFDYFGLASPGNKIEIFAPGIVSMKNADENSLAISPIGDEVFFSRGDWPKTKIMHIKKIANRWTSPEVAEFSTKCYATEPAFSPDGKYLYFSSSKGMKDINNYSIWRIRKTASGWSEPLKVIDIEDSTIWEFHPTVTNDSVYFCKWDSTHKAGEIFKSTYSEDIYSKPEKVTLFNIQSSDANPFVDPHGSYLITTSKVENSTTGHDVYIFYKKGDASWSEPVRFGDAFNTKADEHSFDISPDGNFLFIYKQGDVYWTETKGIIGDKERP
jgi:hypothetical protein